MQVKLSELSKVITKIEQFPKKIEAKTKEFLKRLSELGLDISKSKIKNIVYPGDMSDFHIECEWQEENRLAIVFRSKAILFIEFGTGTYFTRSEEEHPLALEMGYTRGGYGKGRGKNEWWLYPDRGINAGTKGSSEAFGNSGRTKLRITHGNRANRIVYDTGKELREQISKIAQEVFKID